MNRLSKQWLKEIYIAKKKKDSNGKDIIDKYGKVEYDKPEKYLFNVQPIGGTTNVSNGRTNLMDYGQKAMEMQRATIDYKTYFGKFEPDDLAYLDMVSPEGETVYGEKANYRIDGVLNQNKIIVLFFEKLTEK